MQPHQEHYEHPRQEFRHSHAHLGAHWMKMGSLSMPLLIGEFVKDPEKRWKYTKLSLLLIAALEETLWATKIRRQERECREREGR